MPVALPEGSWALILGGSSGFGLATAHKLSRHGMNLCLVHRDRRGAMPRIQPEFDAIRARGVSLLTFNADALEPPSAGARSSTQLAPALGERRTRAPAAALDRLRQPQAARAGGEARGDGARPPSPRRSASTRSGSARRSIGCSRRASTRSRGLAAPPEYPAAAFLDDEDFAQTIHGMGTSLLGWAQDAAPARAVRRRRARLRPHQRGQRGRLEGLRGGRGGQGRARVGRRARSRSSSRPTASARTSSRPASPTRPRCASIPGSAHLKAAGAPAQSRSAASPRPRTSPVIYLLCLTEAAWINGEVIRVDGGEHVSGASR